MKVLLVFMSEIKKHTTLKVKFSISFMLSLVMSMMVSFSGSNDASSMFVEYDIACKLSLQLKNSSNYV